MPSSAFVTQAALAAYRLTQRSGLLRMPAVKRVFVSSRGLERRRIP